MPTQLMDRWRKAALVISYASVFTTFVIGVCAFGMSVLIINKFDNSVILLVSCLVELKLSIFTVISTLARSSAAFGFAVSCLVVKQNNHLLHHQHETI